MSIYIAHRHRKASDIYRDVRILGQKIANSAHHFCDFCANCAQHFNPFFYGTIVCDSGVLSRASWLVGSLKLRVAIQLTLSLRRYLPTTGSSSDVM